MKHNLKTFPRHFRLPVTAWEFAAIMDWHTLFEHEIQQRLKSYVDGNDLHTMGEEELLREILGI
jgi:hypothetical protein